MVFLCNDNKNKNKVFFVAAIFVLCWFHGGAPFRLLSQPWPFTSDLHLPQFVWCHPLHALHVSVSDLAHVRWPVLWWDGVCQVCCAAHQHDFSSSSLCVCSALFCGSVDEDVVNVNSWFWGVFCVCVPLSVVSDGEIDDILSVFRVF